MHPEIGLGFEVVGSSPMGGNVPATRLAMIRAIPNEPELVVLSVEDMIADRMGQYASGTAREMLDQARELYALSANLGRDYLEQRIRTETIGEYGVEALG